MKKISPVILLTMITLIANNVPASLHMYPTGGHGWGFRDDFICKRQWTEELEKWLREINK